MPSCPVLETHYFAARRVERPTDCRSLSSRAFDLRAAGGRPTAISALAAKIAPRHQRRGLATVMLQAMAGLARDAGLAHLIAPVRPTLKERGRLSVQHPLGPRQPAARVLCKDVCFVMALRDRPRSGVG